jgi:hypothetical protein
MLRDFEVLSKRRHQHPLIGANCSGPYATELAAALACLARMSLMSPGFRETFADHEPKPPCPLTAFTH